MSSDQSPFTLNPPLYLTPTTYGSASFMNEHEARGLKLTEQGEGKKFCPYVGIMVLRHHPRLHNKYYYDKANFLYLYARKAASWKSPELQEGNGHLLTIAPTRAGKGTGQIIHNLLTWEGSMLVIDIKGENYFRTAGYREVKLHQKVRRFAPFEKVSQIWNPILSIRADPNSSESTPEEEEDARYLTNLLITPSGNSGADFWENSAKNFLEGLLLYVRTAPLKSTPQKSVSLESAPLESAPLESVSLESAPLESTPLESIPLESTKSNKNKKKKKKLKRKALLNQCKVRERSMREVRRLLSLEKNAFEMLLTVMSKTKRTLISQAGNCFKGFMSGEGKIGQSILATALEQTAVWAYQRVHQVTYKDCKESDPENLEPAPNDIDFSQMRDGKTSIYLIIPPDYLSEYRAVLRVMIGFAMRELRSNFKESKKDPDYQKKPPVLFILDEFPQLAYMRPIEEALLYLAGYDVRFWFFVQDVSQLQLHYKDSWRTFFANTGTQCFFGVSDIATANLVSEMAGMTTVQHTTQTDGISGQTTLEDCPQYQPPQRLPPNYWNNSSTFVSTYRMLITPDEVMRMNENEQIVFMKGLKPILCDRPNYYEFGDLDQCCDGIEPPHDVDYM